MSALASSHDLPDAPHTRLLHSTLAWSKLFSGATKLNQPNMLFATASIAYNTVKAGNMNYTCQTSIFIPAWLRPMSLSPKPCVLCSFAGMRYPQLLRRYHASLSGGASPHAHCEGQGPGRSWPQCFPSLLPATLLNMTEVAGMDGLAFSMVPDIR